MTENCHKTDLIWLRNTQDHQQCILTLGTATLTDLSYSWQLLMYYSGSLSGTSERLGRQPEWCVSSFGRRPESVSVAVGSPVFLADGYLITAYGKHHRRI